jgi:hypothetical protein
MTDEATLRKQLEDAGWTIHAEQPEVTQTVVVTPGRYVASNGRHTLSGGSLKQLLGTCLSRDVDDAKAAA